MRMKVAVKKAGPGWTPLNNRLNIWGLIQGSRLQWRTTPQESFPKSLSQDENDGRALILSLTLFCENKCFSMEVHFLRSTLIVLQPRSKRKWKENHPKCFPNSVMPASYPGVLVQVQAPLLLTQLPVDAPGKALENSPSVLAPVTHRRDPHGVPKLLTLVLLSPRNSIQWRSEAVNDSLASLSLSLHPLLNLFYHISFQNKWILE